jgi:hypothetical protein
MSLAASPRREKRRRLIALFGRSESPASPEAVATGSPAAYAPAAAPERQPALATLVPCGRGGFAAVAAGVLAVTALALAAGVWHAFGGGMPPRGPGRFAATLAASRDCLDAASLQSFAGFAAECWLFAAAVAALVVRSMRRHRRDDFQGRYRAWAWMAFLFVATACAGRMPLGAVVGALGSDATGLALGPAGAGWWVVVAALAFVSVGLWAVVPLHERLATAAWLSACYTAWAVAAACTILAAASPGAGSAAVVGTSAWVVGAALAAIAMLAAARSVIREVRGLPAREPRTKAEAESRAAAARPQSPSPAPASGAAAADGPRPRIAFTDGSEGEEEEDGEGGRHLSKAERRRLRKLARASRAA